MTDELYLIAHKVRNEPAFDVAIKMDCPECGGEDNSLGYRDCCECDGLGYWWVVPTSGHRAYPWRWWPLSDLQCGDGILSDVVLPLNEIQNGIPDEVPDHYTTRATPTLDLAAALGIVAKPRPIQPIKRRM